MRTITKLLLATTLVAGSAAFAFADEASPDGVSSGNRYEHRAYSRTYYYEPDVYVGVYSSPWAGAYYYGHHYSERRYHRGPGFWFGFGL
jgi:hypothetical protein